MNIKKNTLILLLGCAACTGQNNNKMEKLIQAVLKQDVDFLKKNIDSKNINAIHDFSVINVINVHGADGAEHSEFEHDDEKGTLLHLTAWYNLPESAKMLIEKGADVNARDAKGRTPLEVAANRYDVVTYPVQKVLIDNKADVNFYVTKNFLNEPLLFCYIHWRQFELAKLAIKNGADVNMATEDAQTTILEFAEKRGPPAIVSMLKAKGAKYGAKYLSERETEQEQERLYQEYILAKKAEEAEADRKNRENLENSLKGIIIRTPKEGEGKK